VASFESLLRDVLPYVPGCPDSLVQNHIRSATIEFAERSNAYVYDLDPITTVSGVYEYEFDAPSGTEVHNILWMTYDGNDLDPISPRSLELNYPDWRDRTSLPNVYLQKTPSAFWLIPVPQTTLTNKLLVSVALKPTRTTGNIDTTFSNTYRDGILYGTLHRLLRIPQKGWTDAKSANDYLQLFNQEVTQAELKARGGDLGVPRKVHYKGAGASPRKRYRRYGKEIDY
jgi:hypothetical protein|tara:strand:- start:10487 stop:11170 length:684 start_codon:yes stop_codon:yes gene_type:complete